jgi:hypothetical protein
MERTERKTAIEAIGDVPWGSHFCLFYQTKEDLTDILVPYFKAGLENNGSACGLRRNLYRLRMRKDR